MKNLTPWCSLYYSELKYNIKVSPSRHRLIFTTLFYFCFAYITLTFLLGVPLWLGFFILLLAGLIIYIIQQAIIALPPSSPSIRKWLNLFSSIDNKATRHFILSETGVCQFNDHQALQISHHSQVNLWGYWLVFATNDSALKQYFIFKDSLSCQDQARLARTVMRVKTAQPVKV